MAEKNGVWDVSEQMAEKGNNLHVMLPAYIKFGRV